MAKNFFFHSLKIDNYRGLKNLSINSLRRINIIGGFNGTGKSTLLDALFMVLDRRNPMAISRPLVARNVPIPYPDGFHYVFGVRGAKAGVKIETTTVKGDFELTLELGKLPSSSTTTPVAHNSLSETQSSQSSQSGEQIGLHIKTKFNRTLDEALCCFQDTPESANFNQYKVGSSPVVVGVMLSSASRMNSAEDAGRFSSLIKNKRRRDVIQALQFVNPEVIGLEVLTEGRVSVLYATLRDGSFINTTLLGGGFQIILSIVLLMMTSKDGVILFDEIDATIHFSRLTFLWELIAKLAVEQNCQVFAVTHSRECIASAATAFTNTGFMKDMQYIRLENDDNETDAICYTGEELKEALDAKWEIR